MPAFRVALLAAWGAVVLELTVVGVAHRAEITSGWELGMGMVWLAPTALVAASSAAALGALVFLSMQRATRRGRLLFTALGGVSAAVVTALVSSGRRFAAPGRRVEFAVLVASLAVGACWTLYPHLARLRRSHPRRLAAAAAAAFALLELANRFVLVRLYLPFHAALALAALAAASLAACFWFAGPLPERRGARVLEAIGTFGFLALSAALSGAAAARLARFDNFRLLLVDQAPALGQAVRLAAALSPPPPLDAVERCLVAPEECRAAAPWPGGPSFVGRDIVLVTIDALRADHMGAYGYGRPTTPGLDALARESVVFESAYCATPHTSYSVTSLMTGKYVRPLLLQGAGQDSETLATLLRTYGYKTAAFYPPAVFFIDQSRFEPFERSHFGFEYRKVEFLEGEGRARQVDAYLGRLRPEERLLLWVHLFGPHEPYEAHPEHPFGDRDLDRYDSEIRASDDTAQAIVLGVRRARPGAVVIVTADHGEEFGEHGGRYHGTTTYEEQVRVPLLVSAPGLLVPRRIREVVQTIDILPTILSALAIPPSPRLRGRDLGPLLTGARTEQPGFAFAETDESALLAEGPDRLLCARKLGACRLYDVTEDPAERHDLAGARPDRFQAMRRELQALEASHGRFERAGLRAETGRGWPPPILRGIAGDADAALDLAALLDDADRDIRRKSAELLFKLARPESVPPLRLALGRDEDPLVRRWCALALTRLGQTAPLVTDLLADPELGWRRWAALALAESGDAHGEALLIDWWQHGGREDYDRAISLLGAFAKIRSKDAVWPLVQSLGGVRLRPRIAEALAAIGDGVARGPLVVALADERHQTARIAIADALVALGAKEELARPLIRFLGVPDPLPGGVGYAGRAGILSLVGGPGRQELADLARQSNVGVRIRVTVPKSGNGTGVRVVVRATAAGRSGEVRVGRPQEALQYNPKGSLISSREAPTIHDRYFVGLSIPESTAPIEVSALLPARVGALPGRSVDLVVFAERHVRVEALVVVPLADELPAPPAEPWAPGEGDDTQ